MTAAWGSPLGAHIRRTTIVPVVPFASRQPHVSVAHAPTASQLAKVTSKQRVRSQKVLEETARYRTFAEEREAALIEAEEEANIQRAFLQQKEREMVEDLRHRLIETHDEQGRVTHGVRDVSPLRMATMSANMAQTPSPGASATTTTAAGAVRTHTSPPLQPPFGVMTSTTDMRAISPSRKIQPFTFHMEHLEEKALGRSPSHTQRLSPIHPSIALSDLPPDPADSDVGLSPVRGRDRPDRYPVPPPSYSSTGSVTVTGSGSATSDRARALSPRRALLQRIARRMRWNFEASKVLAEEMDGIKQARQRKRIDDEKKRMPSTAATTTPSPSPNALTNHTSNDQQSSMNQLASPMMNADPAMLGGALSASLDPFPSQYEDELRHRMTELQREQQWLRDEESKLRTGVSVGVGVSDVHHDTDQRPPPPPPNHGLHQHRPSSSSTRRLARTDSIDSNPLEPSLSSYTRRPSETDLTTLSSNYDEFDHIGAEFGTDYSVSASASASVSASVRGGSRNSRYLHPSMSSRRRSANLGGASAATTTATTTTNSVGGVYAHASQQKTISEFPDRDDDDDDDYDEFDGQIGHDLSVSRSTLPGGRYAFAYAAADEEEHDDAYDTRLRDDLTAFHYGQTFQPSLASPSSSSSSSSTLLRKVATPPPPPRRHCRRAKDFDISPLQTHLIVEYEPDLFDSFNVSPPLSPTMRSNLSKRLASTHSAPSPSLSPSPSHVRGVTFEDDATRQARESLEAARRLQAMLASQNERVEVDADEHHDDDNDAEEEEEAMDDTDEPFDEDEAADTVPETLPTLRSSPALPSSSAPATPPSLTHRVRISVSAQHLPVIKSTGACDPMVTVELKRVGTSGGGGGGEFVHLARTEWTRNTRNPDFATVFEFEHTPLQKQLLRFTVYDLQSDVSQHDIDHAHEHAHSSALASGDVFDFDDARDRCIRVGQVRLLLDHLVLPASFLTDPSALSSLPPTRRELESLVVRGVGHERQYELQYEGLSASTHAHDHRHRRLAGARLSFIYLASSLEPNEDTDPLARVVRAIDTSTAEASEEATRSDQHTAPDMSPSSDTADTLVDSTMGAMVQPSVVPSASRVASLPVFDTVPSLSPSQPTPTLTPTLATTTTTTETTDTCDEEDRAPIDPTMNSPAFPSQLRMPPPIMTNLASLDPTASTTSARSHASNHVAASTSERASFSSSSEGDSNAQPARSIFAPTTSTQLLLAATPNRAIPQATKSSNSFAPAPTPSPPPPPPAPISHPQTPSLSSRRPSLSVSISVSVSDGDGEGEGELDDNELDPNSASASKSIVGELPNRAPVRITLSPTSDPTRFASTASTNPSTMSSSDRFGLASPSNLVASSPTSPTSTSNSNSIAAPSFPSSPPPPHRDDLRRLMRGVAVHKVGRGGSLFGPSLKSTTLRLGRDGEESTSTPASATDPPLDPFASSSIDWCLIWSDGASKKSRTERTLTLRHCTIVRGIHAGLFAKFGKRFAAQADQCFSILNHQASTTARQQRDSLDIICQSAADCANWVGALKNIQQRVQDQQYDL